MYVEKYESLSRKRLWTDPFQIIPSINVKLFNNLFIHIYAVDNVLIRLDISYFEFRDIHVTLNGIAALSIGKVGTYFYTGL